LNFLSRQLTWRDIQHLTVLTAKRNQLFDPSKQHLWHINGAGLEFNHLFGFGVLDGLFFLVKCKICILFCFT
jgi:proprotein convertase subtilisin/kexin type 2